MGKNKVFCFFGCLVFLISMFFFFLTKSHIISADISRTNDGQNGNVYVNVLDLNGSDGDCTIITYKNVEILIDAAKDNNSYEIIKDKMKKIMEKDDDNVWEYIIFTHPDDDHIGNSKKIINYIDEEKWKIENLIDYEFENRPNRFFENAISDEYKALIDSKKRKEQLITFQLLNYPRKISQKSILLIKMFH